MVKGLVSTGHRPSVIFEEMGLSYYGPIDGHDLPTLIRMLEFAKHQDQPLLLHVLVLAEAARTASRTATWCGSRRRPSSPR